MKANKHKPEDYKAIAFWGNKLGSYRSYIAQEQRRAAREGAPIDAIYYSEHHGWRTIGEIENTTILKEAKDLGFLVDPDQKEADVIAETYRTLVRGIGQPELADRSMDEAAWELSEENSHYYSLIMAMAEKWDQVIRGEHRE